jgi:hypothetical protein
MRTRHLGLLVVAGLVLSACGSPAQPHQTPVLGYPRANKATNTQGWGTIRPKTIFNGGDETGLVKHIVWSSWGGRKAFGRGVGFNPPINGPVAASVQMAAVVVAFDLGKCDDHRSYLRVRWYFPAHNPKYGEPVKYELTCNNYSSSKYFDKPPAP